VHPRRDYFDADWSIRFLPATPGRPGAFPVTVLPLDALEDLDGQASQDQGGDHREARP
jgi:hypothetical protein